MNNIRTYADLLIEKENLETSLAAQKRLVHEGFVELKEEYRPALQVFSSMRKITTSSRSNPLVAIGVSLLGEIFLKNMLLSRSNGIVRFFIPFIAKKAFGYFLRPKAPAVQLENKKANNNV
jgi:hypothetical protein